MKLSFGRGTSGRRLAGLAAGAGLVLFAGAPRAVADDPPPAPPTLTDCWAQVESNIRDCLQLAWSAPKGVFDARVYAVCVKAALEGHQWCLDQVVPPHPRPTYFNCWQRFLSTVDYSRRAFPDPCLPNPDPPGGCTPTPSINHGQQGCIEAARQELRTCRSFVPRPPGAPQGSIRVLPESVLVEPFGKFLNVVVSVEPFGVMDWNWIDVTYVLPNPAAQGSWIEIAGGRLEPTHLDGLGQKPHTVALAIPPAVYDYAENFMLVHFSLYGGAVPVEPIDGDALTMHIAYSQHDLNRDGHVDNADVLFALTRYFAGEFTWAQYQAVLQAAGR